jgi:proteasome lid subunit RPN8/RPN11
MSAAGCCSGKSRTAVISSILPLRNARDDSPRNRFLILPEDFLQGEQEARRRGADIIGFYHSHPDHPARPSEYDREHAWPWYSYLILRVEQGTPREMTGWLLTEDRTRFVPEELTISDGSNPAVSGTAFAKEANQA